MATNVFSGAERIRGTTPSVWVEFTALARECEAVNLGQGFADYPPPNYISDALAAATSGPNCLLNQYTRGFGHPRLVQNLARLYSDLLKQPVDPMKNVLITVGAYHALFYSVFGLINPGDEAIIFDPFFDCYEPQVRMAGGLPVFIPMRLETSSSEGATITSGSLKIDFEELERSVSKKTKIMILNNPHNPTGKLGWAIAPSNVINCLNSVHQNCVYTCPTPIQEAVAESFEVEMGRRCSEECYFHSLPNKELLPKRDELAKVLDEVGMKPMVPEAGYFMMADYSALAHKMGSRGHKEESKDYQFVRWLCTEKKDDTIKKAEEILKTLTAS